MAIVKLETLKVLNWLWSLAGYTFDSNGGLVIKSGALAFVLNREYEFLIETTYLSTVYSQTITVSIQNVPTVPLVTLK